MEVMRGKGVSGRVNIVYGIVVANEHLTSQRFVKPTKQLPYLNRYSPMTLKHLYDACFGEVVGSTCREGVADAMQERCSIQG